SISFTLPITNQPFTTIGDNLHPFFAGMLPEGLRLTALVTAMKTSADDMFSLLIASGPDCIGDVYVAPEQSITKDIVKHTNDSVITCDLEDSSFHELFTANITSQE